MILANVPLFALPEWAMATSLGIGSLALLCAAVWLLSGACRYLLPQMVAFLTLSVAVALFGWQSSQGGSRMVLGISAVLCLLAAALSAQAMAQRMGTHTHAKSAWGCGALSWFVGYGALWMPTAAWAWSASVLALGCAWVMGMPVLKLWHTPRRHQAELTVLVLYSLLVLCLVLYPLMQLHAGVLQVWQGGVLLLILGYTMALLVCAWRDSNRAAKEYAQDALTGLLHFQALEDACGEQPHAQGWRVFMLCDINRFQRMHRQYGGAVGDELLRRFARILKANVRQGDLIARVGPGEFGLLLKHVEMADVQGFIHRINALLADAHWLHKMQGVSLNASFGVAWVRESDNFDTLLHRADVLLYQAQDAGEDCIWVTQPMVMAGSANPRPHPA